MNNGTKILIIILIIIILVKYNELEESLNTSYQIEQEKKNSNILPITKKINFSSTVLKINEITNGFKRIERIPNIIGIIDGSHIPIKASHLFSVNYFNKKGFYLIVLQVVVNHKKFFLDIYIDWPDSTYNSR
ncbi:hypothetical protein C1645_839870 [Glomus cerebriforme]|uniref:DDE Tnp4 domain-containing protein n=1 Tax=Glomus cerebriforme TaxID=658196 RepID=A0A397S761_9GLOM|nr:hypothetical protein C1645_839870 [Glomus cerebriforme]